MANRSFLVLGGVGAIGRVAVRDLFTSHSENRILIADFNEQEARRYAKSFGSRRVTACFADARKSRVLAPALRGCSVVLNCTQHDFNLRVMRTALAARVHYVDLGGLFHWTRRQLKLSDSFKKAQLIAILGAGCAPGITNIMARYAADLLSSVGPIRIRVGNVDKNAGIEDFYFSYSPQTVVEELTLNPWIFRNGTFLQVSPRSGWELISFPSPVGKQWVVRTRHSEIATLPITFRKSGLRHCDFKVGFDRRFVRELLRRLRSGWTVQDFGNLAAPRARPNDYEVARVIVSGRRRDSSGLTAITIDCSAAAKPKWRASAGDIDTGCPLSIVAQMIASGIISQRGVLPPEAAVPVNLFFKELKKRGLTITVKEHSRNRKFE
jgi:saccharopine dehydrogenase-like NADP-dependent oxidoreductase